MASEKQLPWGYRWRSSRGFIISTIIIALFAETFLYGFVVPILSYMLEDRLRMDPSQTQRMTTATLTVHGFSSLVSAPIIAHFADRTPNRKTPLLISLAGCFAGTLLVASTWSVETLFIGRILQAVSGSATWIAGFATLTDNVGLDHMGKALGTAMAFVTAGQLCGPTVAGTLLELVGYWPTWSAPLLVLCLDIVARLLMIERRELPLDQPKSAKLAAPREPEECERAPLLPPSSHADESRDYHAVTNEAEQPRSSRSFYRIMFGDARIVASVTNTLLFATLISAFDATLPLHLRDAFQWNTLSVGMVFLSLQVPSICLGPLVGWLRDRTGARGPATIGWALTAPLLWLLGVPGEKRFPWASAETNGEAIFITGLISIGIVFTLIRGAGTMQLVAATKDMEAKDPKIFGEFGGTSRMSSMGEVAFSLGAMLGPLISGTLSEQVGYFYMNIFMGVICLPVALSCFVFFRV
ncbi:major facilitator superfamily domain-containing protein [Aspergillus bertholletiae]|uniref:Major facilitator superfamily domain-containing protein n=1 Tax=Aspergillus bertholletiae TaxID=1226010 RepID=A0A5N7BLK9_9EURO|nr:major facilitator superfamily domain-containing protein [Aspergillus bertholletiae]